MPRHNLIALCLLMLASPAAAVQFLNPIYLPGTREPSLILAGDLNGDQRADILVSAANQVVFNLYLSSGSTWTGPTNIGPQVGSPLCTIADACLSDLDHDGDLDLVTCSGAGFATDGVRLFLNDGTGHFTLHQLLPVIRPRVARAVDLDGSGWLDIVTLLDSWQFMEMKSPSLGNYSISTGPSYPYANPPGTRPVDGRFQSGSVVGFASDGGLTSGGGPFVLSAARLGSSYATTAPMLLSNGSGRSLDRADFNQDGADDLLIRGPFDVTTAQVIFGNLQSGFQVGPVVNLSPVLLAHCTALGDLDRDGITDLLVGTVAPQLRFLRGNGDGTFTFDSTLPGRSGNTGLLIADLDADGAPDLVTLSDSGTTNTRRLAIRLNLASVLGVDPGSAQMALRAWPNPSLGEVHLSWSLAHDEAHVSVDVLDVTGRVLQKLHDGPLHAGRHEVQWNGLSAASPAPPGIYLARIRTSAGVRVLRFARVR